MSFHHLRSREINITQKTAINIEMTDGGLAVVPDEQSSVFPAVFCAGSDSGWDFSVIGFVGDVAWVAVSVAVLESTVAACGLSVDVADVIAGGVITVAGFVVAVTGFAVAVAGVVMTVAGFAVAVAGVVVTGSLTIVFVPGAIWYPMHRSYFSP